MPSNGIVGANLDRQHQDVILQRIKYFDTLIGEKQRKSPNDTIKIILELSWNKAQNKAPADKNNVTYRTDF